MNKGYLTLLLPLYFVFNSHQAVEPDPFAVFSDSTKITHFYPNPAVNYINFTFDKTVDRSYTLQIYSFMGKKMNESRISDTKLTITLDDAYFRGIYIYQLRDQSGRIVESGKFQVVR